MKRVGRYALHDVIGAGGMGSVHLGQVLGDGGFARMVAIKRLHEHLANEPGALARFRDEARLSARVRHPHVVATQDVVEDNGELLIVMEYVHGATLARVIAAQDGAPFPQDIAIAITLDVLSALSAVHEATDELGRPLNIVHRDVSPTNILVGADGISRVLDFGIAKASVRLQTTRDGNVMGKLSYIAPEQARGEPVGPRTDGYAASVVLWELLAGRRLFDDQDDGAVMGRVLEGVILPPSAYALGVPAALDAVVLRGMARDPRNRFSSCAEMSAALRAVARVAAREEVSAWLQASVGDVLAERAARVAEIEAALPVTPPHPDDPAPSTTLTAPRELPSARETPDADVPATAPLDTLPIAPRRRRWLGPTLPVLGAACIVLVVALRIASKNPEPKPVLAAEAPTTTRPNVPPSAQITPTAPTDEPSTAPPPASVRAPPVVNPPRARPPRHAPSSRPPACDPMFTVDDKGIRRVKPECL